MKILPWQLSAVGPVCQALPEKAATRQSDPIRLVNYFWPNNPLMPRFACLGKNNLFASLMVFRSRSEQCEPAKHCRTLH